MNLTQIERRFQCLQLRTNVVNYKYGPGKNNLFSNADSIKRHVHSEHILKGDKDDEQVYGRDAFEVNYGTQLNKKMTEPNTIQTCKDGDTARTKGSSSYTHGQLHLTKQMTSNSHRSSVKALHRAIAVTGTHRSEEVTFESQSAAGKNVVKLSEKPPGPTPELMQEFKIADQNIVEISVTQEDEGELIDDQQFELDNISSLQVKARMSQPNLIIPQIKDRSSKVYSSQTNLPQHVQSGMRQSQQSGSDNVNNQIQGRFAITGMSNRQLNNSVRTGSRYADKNNNGVPRKHILEQYKIPVSRPVKSAQPQNIQQQRQRAVTAKNVGTKTWHANERYAIVNALGRKASPVKSKSPAKVPRPDSPAKTVASSILNQLYKIKIPDHILNVIGQIVVNDGSAFMTEPDLLPDFTTGKNTKTDIQVRATKITDQSHQDTISNNAPSKETQQMSDRLRPPTMGDNYATKPQIPSAFPEQFPAHQMPESIHNANKNGNEVSIQNQGTAKAFSNKASTDRVPSAITGQGTLINDRPVEGKTQSRASNEPRGSVPPADSGTILEATEPSRPISTQIIGNNRTHLKLQVHDTHTPTNKEKSNFGNVGEVQNVAPETPPIHANQNQDLNHLTPTMRRDTERQSINNSAGTTLLDPKGIDNKETTLTPRLASQPQVEEKKSQPINFKVSLNPTGSRVKLEETATVAMNSVVNLAAAMDPISHLLGVQQDTERTKQFQLKFDLKLTDLSETSNPFVIFKNRIVDHSGYLIFQDEHNKVREYGTRNQTTQSSVSADVEHARDSVNSFNGAGNLLNPISVFPWLQRASELEKRTLKIEVTFRGETILLRFIHLDRLYPVEYPKIALQIAHNMIQNQLLLEEKAKKPQVDASRAPSPSMKQSMSPSRNLTGAQTLKSKDSIKSAKNGFNVSNSKRGVNDKHSTIYEANDSSISQPLIRSQLNECQSPPATFTPNAIDYGYQQKVNMTGIATVAEVITTTKGREEMLKVNVNDKNNIWFSLRPQQNAVSVALDKIKSYELHLTKVDGYLRQNRLISFPSAIPKHLVILVEFADCILQAKDLVNYELIVDDNKARSNKRKLMEQARQNAISFKDTFHIRPICEEIIPDDHGIVIEPQRTPAARNISQRRQENMSKINKNQAAKFMLLKRGRAKAHAMTKQFREKEQGPYAGTASMAEKMLQNESLPSYTGGSIQSGLVTKPLFQGQYIQGNYSQFDSRGHVEPVVGQGKEEAVEQVANYQYANAGFTVSGNNQRNQALVANQFSSFISVSQTSSHFNSNSYTQNNLQGYFFQPGGTQPIPPEMQIYQGQTDLQQAPSNKPSITELKINATGTAVNQTSPRTPRDSNFLARESEFDNSKDPGSLRKVYDEQHTDQKTQDPETALLRRSMVSSSGNENDSAKQEKDTEEKFKVHMMQIDENKQEALVTEEPQEAYSTINVSGTKGQVPTPAEIPSDGLTLQVTLQNTLTKSDETEEKTA